MSCCTGSRCSEISTLLICDQSIIFRGEAKKFGGGGRGAFPCPPPPTYTYLHDILQGVSEGVLNDSKYWTETCQTADQFLNLLVAWQYPG